MSENLSKKIKWNADGLVPVIAQDATTHQVLMHAWMNKEALEKTLATKQMVYFSRSRSALWRKGETSGHTQALVKLWLDCDSDTLLAEINQTGVACHTGEISCFFEPVEL
jgi:phosphoribosyl-AMP cyclohydrolase